MKIDLTKIKSIEFDSRRVVAGSLFVAVRGTLTDGHRYIENAVKSGAAAIVCEELPSEKSDAVDYFVVDDSHRQLALLASEFYGNPSQKLKLIGITGTNGKTTTATLLYDLFTSLGYRVGLLSTVENRVAGEVYPSTHTTPDAVELNQLLAQMVDAGCDYCFMEVSSHSMVQRRVEGLTFAGGVFTNLTHDHLDYHGTFAEYLKAKKSFFDALPKEAFGLINLDDRNGEVMLQNSKAKKATYSLRTLAGYQTKIVESHLDGMLLRINGVEAWVRFIGRFNAYNLTAVYAVAVELGVDAREALAAISTLSPVCGRFDTVRAQDGRLAVVDYAHTPDALKNVLDTINELKGDGQVITVVGCGGDRDAAKRPIMAQIAAQGSSRVILTSDNPRSEEPSEILRQMSEGLDVVEKKKTLVIENRAEAIRTAAALANGSDIILIAGKGHETYQERNGERIHFDDREHIALAFEI